MEQLTAIVLDVQRFSLDDGPGIRTTVFLKGCNMHCSWCHNPESFKPKPQLYYIADKCINCQKCMLNCPNDVHRFVGQKHLIDFNNCKLCSKCVEQCPTTALAIYGKKMTVDQVVTIVLKDINYYRNSKGGVTFSGGEATLNYDFIVACMQKLRSYGVHIGLETNAAITSEKLIALNQYVDLFLIDFKHYDDTKHIKYTKLGNEQVKKNISKLSKVNAIIRLRCPIIPGVNDSDQHFLEIARLVKTEKAIKSFELLAYHSTGVSKWTSLGLEYLHENLSTVDEKQLLCWKAKVNDYILKG